MKIKHKNYFMNISVVFLLLFTGCASFRGNQLPDTGHLSPPSAGINQLRISYSFSSGVDLFGKKEHPEKLRKKLEDEFVSVLRESGYFSSLESEEGAEIDIEVRLVNSGSPAAMLPAFLTGLSLYTIPSWVTDHYKVTAKVRSSGGKIDTYELEDSMISAQWLPLIIIAPFKNMVSVSKDVRQNIWRNLILKIRESGVLSGDRRQSSLRIKVQWVAPT